MESERAKLDEQIMKRPSKGVAARPTKLLHKQFYTKHGFAVPLAEERALR